MLPGGGGGGAAFNLKINIVEPGALYVKQEDSRKIGGAFGHKFGGGGEYELHLGEL